MRSNVEALTPGRTPPGVRELKLRVRHAPSSSGASHPTPGGGNLTCFTQGFPLSGWGARPPRGGRIETRCTQGRRACGSCRTPPGVRELKRFEFVGRGKELRRTPLGVRELIRDLQALQTRQMGPPLRGDSTRSKFRRAHD